MYLYSHENVLLNPLEIRIGDHRNVFSQMFFIYGVNENTRAVFNANGVELEENHNPDLDDVHNTWKRKTD